MRGLLTVVLLCFTILASAQGKPLQKPVDSLSIWSMLKYDAKYSWQSVKHSVIRPAHWKGENFKILGVLVAGTVALSSIDEPANRFFVRQDTKAPKLIKDFGWYFGSPQNYFMLNAGLYGVGLLTKSETIRKTSVLIISSSVTTGLIQSLCKMTIGRARPGGDYGAFEFRPFSSEGAFHSFPSGHTILSMTMAHAIAKQFNSTWAKVATYSIGSIIPLSRLTANAHWLTDTALSAAISIVVVDCIDKFLNNNKIYRSRKSDKKIAWQLSVKPKQIGLVGLF
ncbi:phosphatase PAP2 family protein [Flavisericum labens]|uniref:phosphatase PAP2 family protein n=1 Tax=Flavisericum labens TaxID=3377112 RepID=UPI00387AB1F9